MKRTITLTVSAFLFLVVIFLAVTNRTWAAPPFPSFEQVQQMIANALLPVQDAIDNLTGRTETLEQELAALEERVSVLENSPTPTPSSVPSPSLLDNFDGPILNSELWEVFTNGGTYNFNEGFLVIPGGNFPGMPFFRAKNNPFSYTGSFTVEFGIQYTNLFPAGNGLVLSDGQQANNSSDPNTDLLTIWNSNGGDGLHFAQYGTVKVVLGLNDLSYHVVKFVYDGEKYYAYLDGILKYTSPSTDKASGLWFGHPYYSDLPGWTGFRIDFVKVTNP